MALEIEGVMDGGVHAQKTLRRSPSFRSEGPTRSHAADYRDHISPSHSREIQHPYRDHLPR